MPPRKKFGEILVEAGVINEVALRQALERQKQVGRRLGQVLELMGIIKESDIAVALARQYDYRTVKDFARYRYPAEVLATVDQARARKAQVFPLKIDNGALLLAMVNPLDLEVIDSIAAANRLRVLPCVTTPQEIRNAIDAHYKAEEESLAVAAVNSEWSTILVAEGDRSASARLALLLKGEGYHVEEAATDAEALGMALQLSPHLIVVGTGQLDQLNPFELYSSLRGTIPCFALGSNTVVEEVTMLDAGFVDYLATPYDPARLLARIRRVLKLTADEGKSA